MTRTYDPAGFRTVPGDGAYPGLTALDLGGDRELVAIGTGEEVKAKLREWKEERDGCA